MFQIVNYSDPDSADRHRPPESDPERGASGLAVLHTTSELPRASNFLDADLGFPWGTTSTGRALCVHVGYFRVPRHPGGIGRERAMGYHGLK